MANEDLTHDTDPDRDYDFEDQEFFELEDNDEENDLSESTHYHDRNPSLTAKLR